uniref:Uncharacterized protein n=1 Tax=Pseudomonas aeruginosa TaxID=287 RepID=A0A7S5YCD5_PSEAI|nr:hypothetical protein [Pseudomonas aeruginosa]
MSVEAHVTIAADFPRVGQGERRDIKVCAWDRRIADVHAQLAGGNRRITARYQCCHARTA